jgi:hypothetical protein
MSILAIEIQKERWPEYFKELNKTYQGWAVMIEALDHELGDQPVADGLPLQGISFETKGSAAGDVLIEVGDAGTPYEVHRIDHPRTVSAADTQPGAETDIQIDSGDGTATLIHLRRRPALPPTPGQAKRAGS